METGEILRLLGGFLITIAALIGGALFVRKFGLFGVIPTHTLTKRMKMLETLAIDQKRRVVLIQCDDQEHIVLVGEGETLIATQPAQKPITHDKTPQKKAQSK